MKRKLMSLFILLSVLFFGTNLISCSYIKTTTDSFPVSLKSGDSKDVFREIFTFLSSKAKTKITYSSLENDKFINVKLLLINNGIDKIIKSYNDNTKIDKNMKINIFVSIKVFDKNFAKKYWNEKNYNTIIT